MSAVRGVSPPVLPRDATAEVRQGNERGVCGGGCEIGQAGGRGSEVAVGCGYFLLRARGGFSGGQAGAKGLSKNSISRSCHAACSLFACGRCA